MTADDVKTALDALEAQDGESEAGRVRTALDKGVTLARQTSSDGRDAAERAIATVERGTVASVKDAAAVGRLVQDVILRDTQAALDCVGQIVKARSAFDVVHAQFNYARAQTRTNMERWRSVAQVATRAARAAAQVVEDSIPQRAR